VSTVFSFVLTVKTTLLALCYGLGYWPNDTRCTTQTTLSQPSPPTPHTHILASLKTAQFAAPPNLVYLRDGEVVIYRRTRSLLYQCRYKLADGTWHRTSTRKASIEHAVTAACDLYVHASVASSNSSAIDFIFSSSVKYEYQRGSKSNVFG